MTLLEHTIRKIYEKHDLEFHPEYLNENKITESNHAWMLFSFRIMAKVAESSIDDKTGGKIYDLMLTDESDFPDVIIDKATGDFYPIYSPYSTDLECSVFDQWVNEGRNPDYRKFRVIAFEKSIKKQKEYEAFIKNNQQIKLGLFQHKLLLGEDEIIPFSLRGVKIIGSLRFIHNDIFDVLLVLVDKKGDWFWVSAFAKGFEKLHRRLQRKINDPIEYFTVTELGPSSKYSFIHWPLIGYDWGRAISTNDGIDFLKSFNTQPQTEKEIVLAKKYGRYPLRGELSDLAKGIISSK